MKKPPSACKTQFFETITPAITASVFHVPAILKQTGKSSTSRFVSRTYSPSSLAYTDGVTEAMSKLRIERQMAQTRLEELEQLGLSEDQVKAVTNDAMELVSRLEYILSGGLAQERLTALRQCIESISINRQSRAVRIIIRTVPGADLQKTKVMNAKFGQILERLVFKSNI